MKRIIIMAIVCILGVSVLFSATPNPEFVNFIGSAFSPRQFKDGEVTDDHIQQILYAGSKAPSATNAQPWHFTVVKNKAVIQQVMNNVNDGNILIVVSGPATPARFPVDFDVALATQNLFLSATALGYASRIYAMPVANINEKLLKTLEVPNDYKAYIVVRVGYVADSVDAVTGASPRASVESKSNIIK